VVYPAAICANATSKCHVGWHHRQGQLAPFDGRLATATAKCATCKSQSSFSLPHNSLPLLHPTSAITPATFALSHYKKGDNKKFAI